MGYNFATICTATTTPGPQQQQVLQQMPSGTPQEQGWALLQELEELHERQELQEPPRLPPEDQQELLRIIKELQEELREMLRPGTCWPGLDWTEEIDLWELRGFPTLLLKKLWKLLAHQKTCLHKGDHPSSSPVANPAPNLEFHNAMEFLPNEGLQQQTLQQMH